jgi:acetylornithine aminotransferase
MVEPVQGEAGIIIPERGYLESLRQICDENNWLLILDEIQTGIGRSGKLFAFQHEDMVPDVMTLAKALGNGIPIGACVAKGVAASVIQPGNHGSTFGGNPLACRVGLTVLDSIVENKLAENSQERGEQLVSLLKQGLSANNDLSEIRNLGLLIGIEMRQDCTPLVALALQDGLLINVAAERVIRLLPPLIINSDQVNELAERLITCINTFTS